jgi:WD40 repeat protein/nucleoside phosphorylase
MERPLDDYSCEKALERIDLTPRMLELAKKLVGLMGHDHRVNVETIHHEMFEVPHLNTPQSANAQLNRLLKTINDAAKQNGISLKACITANKKKGAKERWVWFEENHALSFMATPQILTEDLDKAGDRLIDPQGAPRRERPVIVLMTFNEHETTAVLKRFCPESTPSFVTRNGIVYYQLGLHNGAEVILVRSGQGTNEAQSAAEDACAAWQPDWLIGVGIAFGVDSTKQKLGDVLVATFSQGYEFQRVEPNGTITPKSGPRSSSAMLRRRIQQLDDVMRATRAAEVTWPTLHFGGLLCGEKLVDNFDYRNSLVKLYPRSLVGGEMESLGLAISAEKPQYRADWIVVKGISDWADGNKNNSDKKKSQERAAAHAAQVVYETLCFAPLGGFKFFRYDELPALPAASSGDRALAVEDTDSESLLVTAGEDKKDSSLPIMFTEVLDEICCYIPQTGTGVSLQKTGEPLDVFSFKERGSDVIEALLAWATEANSRPLFALFGETGMGKTVTCQLFMKKLAEMRERDHAVPVPLYFNLRNVTGLERRVPTVEEVMLECAERGWVSSASEGVISAATIDRYLEQGAIAIFDGLDEVLVKLTAPNGEVFTRNLLSLLDRVRVRQTGSGGSSLKILVSSRSQYFRTLRDERNHLTGEERGNKGEDSFQALVLLPFDDEQVRQYLSHFIAESAAGRVEELIGAVNNLRELSHRPYTLSFVAEQLPDIERARAEGRTVNGATLYREMARRWLDRDDEKRHLEPRHKLLLSSHLAAHLWKTRSSLISVDDLEEWFHDWLEAQPKIQRLYGNLDRSLLEEDLRNTTFLSRIDRSANDASYRFAHTSFQEFFLAEFLVNAIRSNEPWLWESDSSQEETLCPSRETLDFMGQILAERDDDVLIRTLENWAETASTSVNTILLRYALRALSQNYPSPRLRGIQLPGAKLQGLHIARECAVDLSRANLRGANLRDARIEGCNLKAAKLSDADLFRARVLECELEDADIEAAKLFGTVFWQTGFENVQGTEPKLYQTQFIWCRGLPPVLAGGRDSLVAPLREREGGEQGLMPSARLRSSRGHGDSVRAVSYAPDGKTLASAGSDGIIKLWDISSGACAMTLEGHRDSVWSVSYAPDGKTLASGGYDDTIKLWDISSGVCAMTLEGHCNSVTSVSYAPDGKTLASGSDDDTIKLWDISSGACTMTLEGHRDLVWSVSYAPDGKTLASGSDDDTIKLWDISSGVCTMTLEGHRNSVRAVSYAPDGKTLASAGSDGTIKLWDISSGVCTMTLEGHRNSVRSVSYAPDGKTLASGGYDNTIKLWDISSGVCAMTLEGHRDWVRSMSYAPDGKTLASGSDDNTVKLWDVSSGMCLMTLKGHSDWVTSVSYAPDGKTLASGSEDDTIKLWDISSGMCLMTLEGHRDWVTSVSYAPDGKTLASGSDGGTIKLWDISSGACTMTLEGHRDSVWSVSYAPDGKTLASGSDDNTIKLWDTLSGACTTTLKGHRSRVASVSYAPDGKTLASGGYDNTVKLWDVSSGAYWGIELLPAHQYAVWDVDGSLRCASEGAWEYLGWQVPGCDEEAPRILPAETFGPLPLSPER